MSPKKNYVWLEKIVGQSLTKRSEEGFMTTAGYIPLEMLDESIETTGDWKGWKPINSILNDKDLNEFENKIGIKLPASYRHFLMHKHFFHLSLKNKLIYIPKHLPDKNLEFLWGRIYNGWNPGYLIEKGFIHFADYDGFGDLLCFDSNHVIKDNEYPIVYIDHEDLEQPYPMFNSFRELLESENEQ